MLKRKPEVKAKDKDTYEKEANFWTTDAVVRERRSKRNAYWLAGFMTVVAGLAVGAVNALTPLKTVEPFIVRTDGTTGIVDLVRPLDKAATTYGETIDKYWAQQYVKNREGYSRDLAAANYRAVGLMSIASVQQDYYEWFNPGNPASPLNIYGQYAKVQVIIKSVSFLAKDIALVRYVKQVQRGGDKPQNQHWAATIKYKYSNGAMNDRDREVNPLGYLVLSYRNDPESLTATEDKSWKAPEPQLPPPAPSAPDLPNLPPETMEGSASQQSTVPAIPSSTPIQPAPAK